MEKKGSGKAVFTLLRNQVKGETNQGSTLGTSK